MTLRRAAIAAAALVALLVVVALVWFASAPPPPVFELPKSTGPQQEGSFRKVILEADEIVDGRVADTLAQPMELGIARDGRVFYVERFGEVRVWKPDTRRSLLLTTLGVYQEPTSEEGLLGMALDPRFDENGWLYVQYSRPEVEPGEFGWKTGVIRTARFRVDGDSLDPASEQVLLEVRMQREECCHAAGGLAFDAAGNLYIGTGENRPASAGGGWAPIDERPGHEMEDSQRTAPNSNDLRGKVLRIHPEDDGSYTIPEGNLFAPGTAQARPEIYVMGARNPFRLSVDRRSGLLYFGDPGPDAGKPPTTVREQVREALKESRGPVGHDEINQVRAAGNFGWPYFIAKNLPYLDWDPATETLGAPFDPARPRNDSPNNTGIRDLPPAQPALLAYAATESEEYPLLGKGGRVAVAGPVYYWDDALVSDCKLPREYDHTLFIADWQRSWIMAVRLDAHEQIARIERFLPTLTFLRPIELELGPDGCLYAIEWGTTWGQPNLDSQIVRIEYRAER